LLCAVLVVGSITPALAQFSTIYTFPNYTDGFFPRGGLAMDNAGALYGTTQYGGVYPNSTCGNAQALVPPCGTIYKLTPPTGGQTVWSYQLLHSMLPVMIQTYNEDGERPLAPLTSFQNVLYGVNSVAGDTGCGCGNIFSITPGGTYTVLHVFDPFVPGANDFNQWPGGLNPVGGLLIGSDGTMYGTTSSGGTGGALGPDNTNGAGTVYKISTVGANFSIIHNFDGSLNTGPQGMLIFGQDGFIYGTSYGSGAYGEGFIFKMDTGGGNYSVLYSFKGTNQPGNSTDGANPEGRLALGPDGTIYGTTTLGGSPSQYGTAWSIKNGTYTQLYRFNLNGEGALPHSGLILIGNDLYGTTTSSGPKGGGTVYKLVPPAQSGGQWTYVSLHNFTPLDPNGDSPYGDLLYANGKLFGVNISGGNLTNCTASPNGCGTVFEIALPHAQHDFNGDGMSDIVFRNAGGTLAAWLMNGATPLSTGSIATISNSYTVIGQRDFNGDGSADFLWRDGSGNLYMWFMDGLGLGASANLGNVPATWSVKGTGDMNGDGYGDLVWQDTSGNLAIWFMSAGSLLSSASLGNVPTSTWTIQGVTAGNIFWRDTSGDLAVWRVNGTTVTSTNLGAVPSNWLVDGIGDFDGDGVVDILFRDTASGTVAIWFLNSSGGVKSTANVGAVSTGAPTWHIVEVGDFNGDGNSDILWADSSNNLAIWFLNGSTIASVASLGELTGWTVQTANAQ